SSTPLTASASAVWTCLMRPLAMADDTIKPCARPGKLYSPAYFAAPVTFSRPSMREVDLPRYVVAVMRSPAVSATPHDTSSAALLRQGLCATPPSAKRAPLMASPSSSRPAATETSAKVYDRRSRSFRYV